jgi:hypothetical protein
MTSLARLSLITLIFSTNAVALAQSLLTYRTPQIPSITSEWQRPDWTAALVQAKDYLHGFNITEKITLATGVGWQNSLSQTCDMIRILTGLPSLSRSVHWKHRCHPKSKFPGSLS